MVKMKNSTKNISVINSVIATVVDTVTGKLYHESTPCCQQKELEHKGGQIDVCIVCIVVSKKGTSQDEADIKQ